MELQMGIPEQDRFWDEFHPNVYRMGVSAADDYQELTFGMREAGVVDGRLFINSHPVYLRGAMMDDYFPEWGRMPTDVATWEKIFRRLESMGLNHVRFNGYCPVEAAFTAADKVGMYLQPEGKSLFELMSVGDSCYVWNDGYIAPIQLNQSVIYGADMMQYKMGIEQRLLNDSIGHFLLLRRRKEVATLAECFTHVSLIRMQALLPPSSRSSAVPSSRWRDSIKPATP